MAEQLADFYLKSKFSKQLNPYFVHHKFVAPLVDELNKRRILVYIDDLERRQIQTIIRKTIVYAANSNNRNKRKAKKLVAKKATKLCDGDALAQWYKERRRIGNGLQ